jgi:hypothetical protein
MRKCLASPRKTRYRSQHDALTAARQAEWTHNTSFHVYRCSGCSGWHLTTRTRE